MALSVKHSRKLTLDGRTFTVDADVSAEVGVKVDKLLAKAGSGTLTARVDNDTGTVTLAAGHGIVTGRVDVYWDGGRRYGMAATVTVNSVALDLGGGDNLPVLTTPVRIAQAGFESITFTGDGIAAMGALTTAADDTTAGEAMVVFTDGSGTYIAHLYLQGVGQDYMWTNLDGVAHLLAGQSPARIYTSHGDPSGSKYVRFSAALN